MKNAFITLLLAGFITSVIAQLPDPGFKMDSHTAIVITDPPGGFSK